MTETGPPPPEGDWLGTPYLRFERSGPFGVVTIDRPERRNAMTPAMYWGVRVAVQVVAKDPDLAGLLITGTGDVFCPGGDLGGDSGEEWMHFEGIMPMEVTPFEAIRQSPKPVVAAVNGLCQGGGLVIAMMCDVAVVSETSTFRVPELYRGIADTQYANVLPAHIGIARARLDRPLSASTKVARLEARLGATLERRPPAGIWGGLWAFPEPMAEESAPEWSERVLGQRPTQVEAWSRLRHGFTHFELEIEPIVLHLPRDRQAVADRDLLWCRPESPPDLGYAAPVSRLLRRLAGR
jgi:enoyl-CoA hydratase/carnithine racemase